MPKKSTPKLDEEYVQAIVRRVSAHLATARIDPEWLALLGLGQKFGHSRVTAWRIIAKNKEAIRVRRLSHKLVLYHVGDFARALENTRLGKSVTA